MSVDPPRTRRRLWAIIIGVPLVLIAALLFLFQWDWLIPLVNSRASAAIGRKVMVTHLHAQLGKVTHIDASDVIIANPPVGGVARTPSCTP